ncbi:integrin alpha [Nitrosomonas supralitoralis]|uniref:FG-GAP repeat-containing protein n=1 Tax=Nitrosomonas supralitoralis TaxID=2116706 RepID=A0A2P7NR03_9PROT|nr:integrin alpha [Nitrosomonas supralitoralis]PSJ15880.1 hypothetical protein C7H79_16595 [Nitrosomonas supralitoralis]
MATHSINVADLDGNNGFRLDGMAANNYSGFSVSNAGDVNGDGLDDFIIGAPRADSNGTNSGSSYVVFGKASGFNATMNLSSLNGSNGFRLNGLTADDLLGSSVSNAGDVNGDGLDDLIIGAPRADSNGTNSGSSYVVFGKLTGFSATLDPSTLNGDTGFRVDGESSGGYGDSSGIAVSSAGDINGDGYDDLIIGVSREYNSPNPENPITVEYVVFGKASGFSSVLPASSLDGSKGFRVTVSGEVAQSTSVSSAGDVNGDGIDDLIIGINFERSYRHITDKNDVYIIFGKTSDFDSAFDLASLDGSNGFRLPAPVSNIYDTSGLQVSSAGDINGDGINDLIIGSPSDNTDSYHGGNSYVVFGKDSGFDATLNLLALDGSDGFRMRDEAGIESLGISVSSAGDVNGDGFDDVVVGEIRGRNASDQYSGTSYVVFGKASGFNAILDLSKLDVNDGFRLDGFVAFDRFGTSVSGAGDVNGDGFDDLLVGAPGADPNGESSGSSYVIFGRSSFDDDVDFLGTPGDDNFTGTPAAESFVTGDGNDRMIGRGGADSFDGGTGNDYIRISDATFQLIDGGSGTDTLGLAGSGFNLDLSTVHGKIHGIETISLYGVGDNLLTLTAQDVLDLSDSTDTLKIKGNAGDSVVGLSNGWADGGIHGNFHTYTQGDAVVLVGVDVTTDFA